VAGVAVVVGEMSPHRGQRAAPPGFQRVLVVSGTGEIVIVLGAWELDWE
jgi:hypothetical protein